MSDLVGDWLLEWAEERPDARAVNGPDGPWTFGGLVTASEGIARALGGHGHGEGSRIACLLRDDATAVALVHAVRRLGAVLVPLNRRAASPELGYQLAAAGVDALVHDEAHAAPARTAASAGASAVPLLPVDSLRSSRPLSGQRAGAGIELRDQVRLDAAATILFTSGTTSRPKAAVLTHGQHLASARAWAALLAPRPGDRWLACLPLFHVAGLAMVMRASRWGVGLEVHAGFDVRAVDAAFEEGVSHVSLVAPLLERLLDERGVRPAPPRLRAILLGGGPAPRSLLRRANAAGLPVVTTYGMTETASGLAAGVAQGAPGTDLHALRPLPGAEVRLNEAAVIEVRGPMVFSGYLDAGGGIVDPRVDGWFATGDMGRIDADGNLHVSDRRDDLFISGGENVYPAEVEAVLTSHPDVREAAVLGRPDERWGTVPVALIVTRPDAAVSDATLAMHCREELAAYKVPVAFMRRDALPRNASGKIQRSELRLAPAKESD